MHRRPLALAVGLLLAVGSSACAEVPVLRGEVVRTFPHDRTAFTEGLFYRGGWLYESTGLEGRSNIRRVRLEDGAVMRQATLPKSLFGEGIVDWGNEIVSVTWRGGQGFRWDLATLRPRARFAYPGEGWGLTRNDRELILSDGTATLRFLDPVTFRERRRIQVTADGKPVDQLNELEWVRGELYANVWRTQRLARIDPRDGRVTAWIDLSAVVAASGAGGEEAVLNGVAYDAERDRLFVTGKNWPKLFEVRLRPAPRP